MVPLESIRAEMKIWNSSHYSISRRFADVDLAHRQSERNWLRHIPIAAPPGRRSDLMAYPLPCVAHRAYLTRVALRVSHRVASYSRLGESLHSMKSLFGPRKFRGGRVQVYGCSPGCLLLSLLASIVLTVLLNLLLNWWF